MGINPRRALRARALDLLSRAGHDALRGATASPPIAEFLEKRELLSHSVSHGNLAKLDSTLLSTYQQYLNSNITTPGNIEVQGYANIGKRSDLAAALKKLKGVDVSGTGREVDAYVPVSNLGKVAALKSLRFATTPSYTLNTGSVTSQGDTADIAAAARAQYNISGAGVTVGILSDSFNTSTTTTDHYSTDVGTGDLPANVQILADDSNPNMPGTDEGRAMAQVIYDSAPGVTIKFATAYGGASQSILQSEATFASNIIALANAGCKVIVDDVTDNQEPMFVDGAIAQAAETVIARGVTYISAAGNAAEQSYASSWRAGNTYTSTSFSKDMTPGVNPPSFYGGTSFNFGSPGAVVDMDSFQLGPGQTFKPSFQWDQPYYSVSGGSGCQIQLDIYVLSSNNVIEGGASNLTLGADPIQFFQFTNPSSTATNTYKVLIVNESSSPPGYIKWVDLAGQATNWAYSTNSSTVFGHANAAGVISVAAVNYANTPAFNNGSTAKLAVESYSGLGGTPILFSTSGTRLSSQLIRQEPVVAGPDALANTFFGSASGSTTHSFTGTSAAAASVAGVAALLLQINPTLTPTKLSTILQQTTIAIGTTQGQATYLAGYGLVQTQPAVAMAVGNVTGAVFSDNNANSVFDNGEPGIRGVTVFLDLNNNGVQDAGEPVTTTAANGLFAFYNVPTGTSTAVRAVTPSGYVATVSSQSITISGGNTTPSVYLGFFPDLYTASSASYTLQRDATTTANDDIYVGSTLTYTAPISIIPSLTFNLGGNNSSLTINYVNGNPVPTSGGVIYNANASGTGNALIMNGTAAVDTVDINYQTTTFNGGVVVASGIQSETINGSDGNNVFSVTQAQPGTESLTFNGGIGNNSLTVNDGLPNNGVGTLFNAGTTSTDQSKLTVNMGTFTFGGDPAAASANLTINDNSNVVFASGALSSGFNQRNIAALNIGTNASAMLNMPPSHGDRAVLVTNTLSISSTGLLDLSGNDLIVTSGTLSTLSPQVGTGFANGKWTGPGIQSSAAASDTTLLSALGIVQNNGYGSPLFGSGAPVATFDGVSPAPAAILVKYTYYGDTNLSGKVDGDDYSRIDVGFLSENSGFPGTGWANGDFNYDGTINGSDYTLIDNAYNSQGSGL